jgi:hypothetical protein
MDKATLEIINNVPYAVLSDGRKVKYADIMAYNNPGMQYDDVTLDVIAATPASAEAGMMPGGEAAPDTFGDTTSRMASPYFETAADLASTAGRRPTYFQNPLMQGLERTGQYIGDMGLAGVNAAMGGVYGGAGLLGEAFGGDTQNERRLARDLAAMFDVAGPAPEGRALGLLTDAAMTGRMAPSRGEFLADESGALKLLHSSPHDFDRFSMSQIGTGEGAQAYGHGLYFAESPSVSGRGGDYWRQFFNKMPSGPERTATGAMYANRFDPEKAASQLEANVRYHADRAQPGRYGDGPEIEEGNRLLAEETQRALDMIKSGQIVGPRTYEVSVNANPEDFLDWDRLLSEQPEVARRIGYSDAARIAADRKKLYGQFSAPKSTEFEDLFGPLSAQEKAAAEQLSAMPEPWNQMTGKDAWFRASKRKYVVEGPDGRLGPGADTYEEAVKVAGGDPNKVRTISDPAAPARAEFMREAGVPGIRYLDAGSRNVGDGSRNYVVFDENLINIVRKYGVAGAAAMLGVSALDVEQAMAQGQQRPQGLLSMGAQ